MEKEFVPYEQAINLKELGFNESCFGYYINGYLQGINLGMEELGGKKPYYQRFGFHTITPSDIEDPFNLVVVAPLYQQTFDWFLEKYNIFAETTLWGDGIGYMSSIKEIRQEEFKVVYDLGLATPNRGLPNWDRNTESLVCIKRIIEIIKSKGSLDSDKWRVLVNPMEREDFLLSISSSSPDESLTAGYLDTETYHTEYGTYEVIWEADKEQPIVRKLIKQ
jgi:hypothetical protein